MACCLVKHRDNFTFYFEIITQQSQGGIEENYYECLLGLSYEWCLVYENHDFENNAVNNCAIWSVVHQFLSVLLDLFVSKCKPVHMNQE
jgi:hypothetical protein